MSPLQLFCLILSSAQLLQFSLLFGSFCLLLLLMSFSAFLRSLCIITIWHHLFRVFCKIFPPWCMEIFWSSVVEGDVQDDIRLANYFHCCHGCFTTVNFQHHVSTANVHRVHKRLLIFFTSWAISSQSEDYLGVKQPLISMLKVSFPFIRATAILNVILSCIFSWFVKKKKRKILKASVRVTE